MGDIMKLITVKEAAEKWGISARRVQILCSEGRIKGTVRFGRAWMIPSTAVLPTQKQDEECPTLPMPRKTPFLDMTNVYNEKGKAEECGELLINNHEAYLLYETQIAYRKGEIDKVYDRARYFLRAHSGFYAILRGGMLLAQCAIWRGDINLWNEAKRHICEAPCMTQAERDIVSLSLAIINSTIYDSKDYPEWFKIGNFELLPSDSHPTAKVFYVKYIYMTAYAIASKEFELEGIKGLSLMRILPNAIEPLITQAVVDKTIIPEIYLRLSCAVAYYYSGAKDAAIAHIDKALELALADGLYGILTEYVRHFDGLLQERIRLIDPSANVIIEEYYQRYKLGWAKLSSAIKNKFIVTNLSQREHEIAKLTVFGFGIKEISAMLSVSESTVKQTIVRIMNKAGIDSKKEFALII